MRRLCAVAVCRGGRPSRKTSIFALAVDFDPQGPPSPNTFISRCPLSVDCVDRCYCCHTQHDDGATPGERRESLETPGAHARAPGEPSQHGRTAPAPAGRCKRS